MIRRSACIAAAFLLVTAAHAGNVAVTAVDRANESLPNVVVSAIPLDRPVPPRQSATATVAQQDFDFVLRSPRSAPARASRSRTATSASII